MQSLLDQGAVVTVRLQDRPGGGQNYLVSIYGSKFVAEKCIDVEQLLCLPEKVGDRAEGSSLFDVLAWTAFATEVTMQRDGWLYRVSTSNRRVGLAWEATEVTLELALDRVSSSISAGVPPGTTEFWARLTSPRESLG